MTKAQITGIESAMSTALAQHEEAVAQAFPTSPNLVSIVDANFWAVADISDGPSTITNFLIVPIVDPDIAGLGKAHRKSLVV